ncbi:MAG: ribosome maturation factor RimM [Micavibrio sp.]
MSEEKRILIAEIATAHGIKGHVKLRPFVEDQTLLEHAALYTEEEGGKAIRFKLKGPLKDCWIAEVEGVADRNAAELLRGTQIYIGRAELPQADEGEYYIEDLKGLRVLDEQGAELGTINAVQNFGASDLIDIRPVHGGEHFYLPFTDEIVLEVDQEAGTITVRPPETV